MRIISKNSFFARQKMNREMSMGLNEAKQNFVQLMRSLNRTDQQKFLAFIMEEWKLEPSIVYSDSEDDAYGNKKIMDKSILILNSIVSDIKQKIPFNALLASENITTPLTGENSDCDPNITVHIDEFLYSDEDIDELVDNNQLQRCYCTDCGSKSIQPLIPLLFNTLGALKTPLGMEGISSSLVQMESDILCVKTYPRKARTADLNNIIIKIYLSHSMSQDGLFFIFKELLPSLKNKTVLDVGSRLGAVLYGAYVCTDARRIIGVEMNEEFCNLQNEIICKYKMNDRISILHKRIEEVPETIKQSDVIVINNAFEFYLPRDVQIDIWKFLKAAIKPKTLLVTRPSIEATFKTLSTGISVEKWLKPFKKPHSDKFSFLPDNEDKFTKIYCYEVL